MNNEKSLNALDPEMIVAWQKELDDWGKNN
jgi:hypothetical protein